jgi:hypothetical protein
MDVISTESTDGRCANGVQSVSTQGADMNLVKIIQEKESFVALLDSEIGKLRILERNTNSKIFKSKQRGIEELENQLCIIKARIKRERQIQFLTKELIDYMYSDLFAREFKNEVFV